MSTFFNTLWLDVRYAFRMMVKAPGLTAILVTTLALGIGASTTIFSVVNSVLLRPLPYKDPDRLVRIYTEFHSAQGSLPKFWMSPPELDDLRTACRTCGELGAWANGSAVLAGGDRPVRVDAAYTTASLAKVIGARPMLGRWFDAKEDAPGGDPTVVVLGHGVWQRAFAGDPAIVGQQITLDAMPVTVIGVMGPGFDFLDRQEAWAPLKLDPAKANRGSHFLSVVATLAPGVSIDSMRAELHALTTEWGKQEGPARHAIAKDHPLLAVPFQDDLVGSIATSLWLLQGAVLFVLLISIVNIANLLLARSEARTREVAIRHALGANRRRLMRQFVTESMLLGLLGGALGILVSVWAVDAIVALIPKSAPRENEISLDGTSVVFSAACALGAALLFGIAPILHARKTDVHSALKDGGNRMTGNKARLRARRVLVVAEIVLAVVLVVGCTVMVRSFIRLQNVNVGFDPANLLTFGIELPEKTYPGQTPDTFWRRAHEGLGQLPGVRGVAVLDGLPPNRTLVANSFSIPGRVQQKEQRPLNADHWQTVGDGALEVMGARIVKGRSLLPSDTFEAPSVIVVNQSFADAFFPGEDPIGKQVRINSWEQDPKVAEAEVQTIVGVVADIKNKGIDKPAGTEVFIPIYQYAKLSWRSKRWRSKGILHFAIRTEGNPREVLPGVHAKLAEIDPTLPLFQVRTMDDVLWEANARPRFLAVLLTCFAGLALLLAGVGIYGVMSHTVAQRTHEIGLRVALGAQPRQVALMVLRQAGILVVIGVVVGIALSIALEQLLGAPLHKIFYGEHLAQPLLLFGVAAAVAVAAVLATWIPVRRATRVEPTVALRSE